MSITVTDLVTANYRTISYTLCWQEVSWSDCSCLRRNRSRVRRSTSQCGAPTFAAARVHAIGWKLPNNMFVPELTVCFDHEQETTLYVVHRILGRYY